uniref:Uncharacterized protein n=1 Tax=Romanomermis culicivorax TaxID=13658 RepID=A0A915KX64_ROMCU
SSFNFDLSENNIFVVRKSEIPAGADAPFQFPPAPTPHSTPQVSHCGSPAPSSHFTEQRIFDDIFVSLESVKPCKNS